MDGNFLKDKNRKKTIDTDKARDKAQKKDRDDRMDNWANNAKKRDDQRRKDNEAMKKDKNARNKIFKRKK